MEAPKHSGRYPWGSKKLTKEHKKEIIQEASTRLDGVESTLSFLKDLPNVDVKFATDIHIQDLREDFEKMLEEIEDEE